MKAFLLWIVAAIVILFVVGRIVATLPPPRDDLRDDAQREQDAQHSDEWREGRREGRRLTRTEHDRNQREGCAMLLAAVIAAVPAKSDSAKVEAAARTKCDDPDFLAGFVADSDVIKCGYIFSVMINEAAFKPPETPITDDATRRVVLVSCFMLTSGASRDFSERLYVRLMEKADKEKAKEQEKR